MSTRAEYDDVARDMLIVIHRRRTEIEEATRKLDGHASMAAAAIAGAAMTAAGVVIHLPTPRTLLLAALFGGTAWAGTAAVQHEMPRNVAARQCDAHLDSHRDHVHVLRAALGDPNDDPDTVGRYIDEERRALSETLARCAGV